MKRLNNKIIIASCVLSSLLFYACSKDFLNLTPIGQLDEEVLNTRSGVQGLLIGAYSLLDGNGAGVDDGDASVWNVWLGSVGADDSHKGGGYSSQTERVAVENHSVSSSNPILNNRWRAYYAGVQRANEVIRGLNKMPVGVSEEESLQMMAEARLLRGIYHLEAIKVWRNIPFVDETITFSANNFNTSNTESAWPKIEADFKFAADNLTATKANIGRGNSWAAKSFLAKAFMFQLKFAEAKVLLDDVIANGTTTSGTKYALLPEYSQLYRAIYDNGPETVFAVQMSVNDGATGDNGNRGEAFNYLPGGSLIPVGGWGNQPTFTLVNAFKTANGLPMLDTFNVTDLKNNMGLPDTSPFTPDAAPVDPRLDWTVARRGLPVHDWGINNLVVNLEGGPYNQKKVLHWKQDEGGVSSEVAGGWVQTNGTNYNMIRFADVLLWAAEVEVEIGSLEKAEEYVNLIRARAANPSGFLHAYVNDDPAQGFSATPAANYQISQYTGEFTANGKDYARKAVRFERRLELALEGHRFFDLQRWDLAAPGYMAGVINPYMIHERNAWLMYPPNKPYLILNNGETFTQGKNEIYPIPLNQIDIGGLENKLVQNPGY